MYLTIATITHYSYSIERSKDIKISQTIEEAEKTLVEIGQYLEIVK